MSLNNNQMLPERIRNMRQMNDVINAEDIVLEEIERIIDDMYQRASLLHEELVNEAWLESKLTQRTESKVEVTGYAEELFVKIVFEISELHHINMEDVRRFLNKWLPAHLMYRITLLLNSFAYFKKEIKVNMLIIRGDFYPRYNIPYLMYNGTAMYNGRYRYNGYKTDALIDLYPIKLSMLADCRASPYMLPCMAVHDAARQQAAGGDTRLACHTDVREEPQIRNRLTVKQESEFFLPRYQIYLTIGKHLTRYDGTYRYDGTRKYDSEIIHEVI